MFLNLLSKHPQLFSTTIESIGKFIAITGKMFYGNSAKCRKSSSCLTHGYLANARLIPDRSNSSFEAGSFATRSVSRALSTETI